jgi:hypothetical protein
MTTTESELDVPTPSSAHFGKAAARDIDGTGFTAILERLLRCVPGAYAAVLVDSLGETVDYAGRGDPFDLRVVAAHVQIVLASIDRFGALGRTRWVVIRGAQKSFAANVLPDGYVLALVLRAGAAFTISTRALAVSRRALAKEAGWHELEGASNDGSWFAVTVVTDGRGRPTHVGAKNVVVEVLGTVMGLSVRERGFRVRTVDGSELTLVREPKDCWYADQPT